MAKLIFVLALALLVLQGSEAFPKNPVLSSNVQDLVFELNNLIKDTNTRFNELFGELKDKIVTIENEANFPGLMTNFKNNVAQLLTQDKAKACGAVAHEQILQVERLAAVFTCKFEIDDQMSALQIQMKVLTSKVVELVKNINNDVDTCMVESHGSFIKFTRCIDEQLISVKQYIQILEKEIQATFDVIKETMPLLTDKIFSCVANNKKVLKDKIKEAEETIATCVGVEVVAVPLKKSGFAHVSNYLQYLQKEVDAVLVAVPASVLSVQDKLNVLVSRHNVQTLVVEAKRVVLERLSKHAGEARLCGRHAHELLDSLAQDAQLGAELCQADTQRVVDDLEHRYAQLAGKARVLVVKLSEGMLTCAKDHLMLDVVRCMEHIAEEVHEDLVQLQKEMRDTTLYAEQAVDSAVLDLDVCLTKVDDKVKADKTHTLNGLNTCFKNVHLLF